jgi:hypothetical protein
MIKVDVADPIDVRFAQEFDVVPSLEDVKAIVKCDKALAFHWYR